MLEAAEKAKEQYLKDHPEAENIDMKYDPIKLVEKCKYLYSLLKNEVELLRFQVWRWGYCRTA